MRRSVPSQTPLAVLVMGVATVAMLSCWNFDEAYNNCIAAGGNCVKSDGGTDGTDSGTTDSGTTDSGTPDSGTPDSGTPDSGVTDGGTRDGGQCPPNGLCYVRGHTMLRGRTGLYAPWGTSPDNVIIGGMYEALLVWDGTNFAEGVFDVWYSPYVYDIHGTSNSDIWAVGSFGEIIHYDGYVWSSRNPEDIGHLYGVWALPSGDAWVAGEKLWRWRPDSGSSVALDAPFSSLWSADGGRIWAVGSNGTDGLISQNVGGTWSAPANLPGLPLRAVWGNADNNVWAVGSSGTIIHFTSADGGTWVRESLPPGPTMHFRNVWVSKEGEVFATAFNRYLAKRQLDGGWRVFEPPDAGGMTLVGVYGFDNGDLWLVGGDYVPPPTDSWNGGAAIQYLRTP